MAGESPNDKVLGGGGVAWESCLLTLLLMIYILHDPIYTILPLFLRFWCIRSCSISTMNQ